LEFRLNAFLQKGGPVATTNLTQTVYKHLQGQLISGALPTDTVVSEEKLAAALGVSRTSVGNARRRLVAEGLMEQVPRYGTIVKEVTRQAIEENYELREAVEPYAVRKASVRITKPQLEQLSVLCQAIQELAEALSSSGSVAIEGDSLQTFLAVDLAFHLFIIQASGNRRALEIARKERFVSQVFRTRRGRHDAAIVHSAYDDHSQIVSYLKSGDGEAAERRMFEHIWRSKKETLTFFDDQQRNMLSSDSSITLGLSDSIRQELGRFRPGYELC
jgi:DNA-binding GntR family transcriptional regulator